MKKRDYLIYILFLIINLKGFSCPHLVEENGHGKTCSVARVFIDDTLPELVNGEKIYGEQIRGVVYFEGFDFPNYEAYFVSHLHRKFYRVL